MLIFQHHSPRKCRGFHPFNFKETRSSASHPRKLFGYTLNIKDNFISHNPNLSIDKGLPINHNCSETMEAP